jgi:hypothetical protein
MTAIRTLSIGDSYTPEHRSPSVFYPPPRYTWARLAGVVFLWGLRGNTRIVRKSAAGALRAAA